MGVDTAEIPIRIDAPDDFELRDLTPLGDYLPPALPTDETIKVWWNDLKRLFHRKPDAPYMESAKLQETTLGMLDDVVAPPACGPVLDEIERNVDAWLTHDTTPVKIIVTPPCDENCVIETWAKEHDYEILPPPQRALVTSRVSNAPPDISGKGVLVIPSLSEWFLRHRNGLDAVRQLFEAVSESDRRCVFGCNSWAWAFLVKSVQADLILPSPEIFVPFDTPRLSKWLSGLARADQTRDVHFRISKTGKDVFSDSDDSDFDKDFFEMLAARSLGIPWVAWHMWRRVLRAEREEPNGANEQADKAEKSDRMERKLTLWISDIESLSLPGQHPQTALLVLHSLLIHDRMTIGELRETIPVVGGSNIVASLIARGFVRRDGDTIICQPFAYPEIRSAMANAGFPMSAI